MSPTAEATRSAAADTVLVEVVRHRLMSTVREMTESLKTAAYSPIIYEVLDFSNALHDPDGNVVAQALGIPLFLGAMSASARAALERIGIEAMRPGDVIISNDPFEAGGTHINDVNVILPIFSGDELVLLANSKAHWQDVGGKDAGSWSPDATNIFQEGIRIPPVKLVEQGEWNEALLDTILTNVRAPTASRGDLRAQIAACRTGERQVKELLDRYGLGTVRECTGAILEHGEEMMRQKIAEIPDGSYAHEDFMDSDGVTGEPVKVRVEVRVDGSDLLVDLTGSDGQAPGSNANTIYAGALSAVRLAVKALLDPELPANEGCYAPIEVRAPEGSCVSARAPAPVTVGLGTVNHLVVEGVFQALAPVLPDEVIAGIYGSVQVLVISGRDADDDLFIHLMPYAGGWGGRATKDGISAMNTIVNGDCYNVPVEIIESKYPLRVERFSLVPDSGGPGRNRGGLGVRTDYRVVAERARMATALMRYRYPPPGLLGGEPGLGSRTVVNPETPESEVVHLGGRELDRGDLVSHQIGGGGGYGDPFDRAPERVLRDVLRGYVSRGAAREAYGVALEENGSGALTVDREETRKLREDGV